MTVIAWDGRILAADKRMSNGGLINTITKIFRFGDIVVATCGRVDQGLSMVDWVKNGRIIEKFPTTQQLSNFSPAAVVENGRLYVYESAPYPYLIEDQFWAAGSGRDFALAAMFLGKTAIEAVQVASAFQNDCGNGCDWFDFSGVLNNVESV
jgi:20S proteasome alpha/beta subunit